MSGQNVYFLVPEELYQKRKDSLDDMLVSEDDYDFVDSWCGGTAEYISEVQTEDLEGNADFIKNWAPDYID